MGYVDLSTLHAPVGGQRPPAGWGRQVRDNEEFLARPPKCRVYNSAPISIATSGVAQALTFDSERFDTDTMHNSGNPGRITFSTAGTYDVGANVSFAASATGGRLVVIRLNGTTTIASATQPVGSASIGTDIPISTIYPFSVGDYIEVVVTQFSGSALNVSAAGNYSPEFWAIWLSL